MEELIGFFVRAVVEIAKLELGLDLKSEPLDKESGSFVTDEVGVVSGILGEWEGQIFFDMPEETARQVVFNILGEKADGDQSMMLSGIAELTNVIAGRASVLIEENKKIVTRISPPTVMFGKNVIVSTLDITRHKVIFHHKLGRFTLRIGLRPGN